MNVNVMEDMQLGLYIHTVIAARNAAQLALLRVPFPYLDVKLGGKEVDVECIEPLMPCPLHHYFIINSVQRLIYEMFNGRKLTSAFTLSHTASGDQSPLAADCQCLALLHGILIFAVMQGSCLAEYEVCGARA